MTTIAMQRDLVFALKKETSLNIGLLSKLHPMSGELLKQIFRDNALEKPTQNVFNHVSHYLVSIIDVQASAALPWPLYDTKTERLYRNELANFISDYSTKGLLTPVMSSYLVNPGCYKVTMLIFQLSQLAVQKVLSTRMKDRQKKLYYEITNKYKLNYKGFVQEVTVAAEVMMNKFSNYILKRNTMERIAGLLLNKIKEMEETLQKSNAERCINDIVDGYINSRQFDDSTKMELLQIKNVKTPSLVFDQWLIHLDKEIDNIEQKWNEKVTPLLDTCRSTQEISKALISRHLGEADKNTYIIEYNPRTDFICTKELQEQVNCEQKYILKNIIKEERLSFPNLIRGFLVAMCFILKNIDIGDDIYKFNEYLDNGRINFNELVMNMKLLIERVANTEARLQPSPLLYSQSIKTKKHLEVPPIPNLSDLKGRRDLQQEIFFNSFTPISISKHQFNLNRRNSISLTKYQPRSLLVTPFHHPPKDDFLRSIISCRISAYDNPNTTQNFHNVSLVSQAHKINETIAECSTGFTKQQIMRLLSTKKSTSSKKHRFKHDRLEVNIKKGALFNESNTPTECSSLFRSHSSPNLFENREKKSLPKGGRKLSIMREDSLLEVSGIAALDNNSCNTPPVELSRNIEASSLPVISIEAERRVNEVLKDIGSDPEEDFKLIHQVDQPKVTPKNTVQPIRKTSSLEKIINRFKKVRASVLPTQKNDSDEFKTIVEEKENVNLVNVDVFAANRVLLPDLLSPSSSGIAPDSNDYLDEICFEMDEKVRKKPRESLGTALGVDHTFLDQFELVD